MMDRRICALSDYKNRLQRITRQRGGGGGGEHATVKETLPSYDYSRLHS